MKNSPERDLAMADELGRMADARIKELESENTALRERLAEAYTWIDQKNAAIETWQQQAKENATQLAQVEKEREPHCWHCGIVLAYAPKLRCEECPAECDVVNCDAFGCVDKTAEQHLDSWK